MTDTLNAISNNIMRATTIREMTAYELSRLADCGTPDHSESSGALFLKSIRDEVLEAFGETELDESIDEDRVHQIADNAPDVYTHKRWQEFVDLQAYDEDVNDYLTGTENLTTIAGLALYVIAERLVTALVQELETENNNG